MQTGCVLSASFVVALLLSAPHAIGVTFGQLDTFEDGTSQDWRNGVAPLANIATGGPAGADDNYIRITADGSNNFGRLTGFNRAQWLGDYISAGVTAIEVHLNNFSAVDLSIRLGFKEGTFNGAAGYLTSAVLLPAGSGWQHFTFSLAPADLTALGGPTAYGTFFSGGLAEVRFIHSPAGDDLNGQFVTGQLGIDNVHAVPEPAVTALTTGGLIALAALRNRKRQRASS